MLPRLFISKFTKIGLPIGVPGEGAGYEYKQARRNHQASFCQKNARVAVLDKTGCQGISYSNYNKYVFSEIVG